MKRNFPDRIKLILQLIVFTLFLWLPLLLIFMVVGAAISHDNTMVELWGSFALSFLIQVAWFLHRWKKLLLEEKVGEFPGMDDPRNIKPFQLYFIILGIVLLVTGYTLFHLYSKLAGTLCFITVFALWAIEIIYIKHRENKDRK